jgi:hypothetical protein
MAAKWMAASGQAMGGASAGVSAAGVNGRPVPAAPGSAIVLWFKNDLRLHDNAIVHQAALHVQTGKAREVELSLLALSVWVLLPAAALIDFSVAWQPCTAIKNQASRASHSVACKYIEALTCMWRT